MTPRFRLLLLAIPILGVIGAIAAISAGPLIYSLNAETFNSPFHENPDALKTQVLNSTDDVLPLMQDLMDYSGPLVLNIRLKDYEQARRDLEIFTQNNNKFRSLVVRLDMNESEIAEFSRSTARQKELLQDLANSSARLDALQNLEIQYREQGDRNGLVSVRLEGEELKKKIHGIYDEYKENSEKITTTGETAGLNTESEKESLQEFDAYVREIESPGTEVYTPTRTTQLTLAIRPESGVYGDRIEGSGQLLTQSGLRARSETGKPVTLAIDTVPVTASATDPFGRYTLNFTIGRLTAGTHSLYAESGVTRSFIETLIIVPVNSTTNLSVSQPDARGEVLCTGLVLAGRPVSQAPVEIVWDKTHVTRTMTDADGLFSATVRLPNGTHTIAARFTGDGYPIRPSQSEPQVVEVIIRSIIPQIPILPLVVAIGILSLFAGGSWYYLRRKAGRPAADIPAPESPALPGPDIRDEPVPEEEIPAGPGEPAPMEPLAARYARILNSGGLGAAAREVYLHVAGRVARRLHIPRHTALTPRELSRSCRKEPFCPQFATFVAVYERVRYGGYHAAPARDEFENEMKNTLPHLGGDDH